RPWNRSGPTVAVAAPWERPPRPGCASCTSTGITRWIASWRPERGLVMRIAWFTPLSAHNAIGHYSGASVRELAQKDELGLFDAGPQTPTRLCDLPTIPLEDGLSLGMLRRLDRFDVAVYNMGNHAAHHQRIYRFLIKHPGVVVLHDLVMRDFFHGYLLAGRIK